MYAGMSTPHICYVLYDFPFPASHLLLLFGKLLSGPLLLPTYVMPCSSLKRTLEGPTSTDSLHSEQHQVPPYTLDEGLAELM
jgi:hypothetical protein